MLAALVVVGTLADGQSLQVDARLPAVAVAAVCIWRRLPFLVVIWQPRRPPPCCAPL